MNLPWRTAWTIARRDLSARFRGLRLLLVCLFLGVGAIAAIGTLTGSIERELGARGREILGGDIELRVWQRGLTDAEMAALAPLGEVSPGLRMQAIASKGDLTAPVALKAVAGDWPLYGSLKLTDGRTVGAPGEGTAWIAQGTAARLGIKAGDSFRIGGEPVKVGGIITADPEQLGEGFALGDVAIVPLDLPQRAGLTAPGAMYRSAVRVKFKGNADPEAVAKNLEARFPDAGFRIRTREKATPSTERFVSRMGEFLVLVGLAALVIAGIGIGGGVSSYLEARRTSIATLKVLGATSGDIARIYLLQVGAAAVVGSLAGLLAGVLVTPLLAKALGTLLPVSTGFTVSPAALATAAAYGLLVALVFAAPPLVRARSFPAMALMRARVSPLAAGGKALALPVGLGLAAIVALALANAAQPLVTVGFLAGAGVMLGLLALVGLAIRKAAARLPRPRDPMLRAGLANLHRPGAQTGALVTALGFGLSAFVLIAAVQTSLDANIRKSVPARAPDFFVLDVPQDGAARFRETVEQTVPGAVTKIVPNLRGKILAYGPKGHMTRVADLGEDIPENAWALRGERGLTYSAGLPEGSTVTSGKWWPEIYRGEPLVSLDETFAEAVGLKVGDYVTVGVLGVERTARVAALRRIDWDTMGFNFVLVFSPNALADAPHNLAATIEVPTGTPTAGLLPRLARAFPSSSVIETGTLLRDARTLLDQMSTAILAAASVAVLAGLAVLLGAIAAARASRTYDNVILRVLGASRRQLLVLQIAEYGLLVLVLAAVALAAGSVMAWAVIARLFEFDWLPNWPRVLAVLGAGLVLVLAFALAGSLPLLRAKPARALREL
ncbi:ABC transporter permease [Novosphingobium mangrovi (ex Huang et al. 2023)]|uniref:FtsX-like permease family protein n=1 Tax=Novosphingobium mangrovi (ex Huang et al. 2023) TaxID=2976432 RepID=A0ABT2I262_9SPHN|nr:FtsX-like permease family protein [Novosphingobium mangrovi (ex Huang et al. 2023)]MCT2398883.1 FtsX-like permease family protein [Novosphingobium mangrovi (ex Huang et al. 2023)]